MKILCYVLPLTLLLFISLSCSTGSDPLYILKTSVSPGEGGSVSPAQGEYDSGTDVEIMASPNEHWVFDSWQGDNNLTGNPATLKMDKDKDITAVFIKREYPLTIETNGEGTVGEEVIQAKSTDYPHGTMVELTALADHEWGFRAWKGAVNSTENPLTVQVENDMEITAVFNECVIDDCLENDFSKPLSSPETIIYIKTLTTFFPVGMCRLKLWYWITTKME